ncbi:hypothetical protein PGT21_030273 [Puccinia graminis f. sp. tritici]|uniref:Uncharacterized protein n=1 Tax=Puccinia graminis f. sp. tritici TaxID=56615 RepID=A0A5B0PM95_PUCGR|nr:hypothetical protein PGT21_030273 [Puccinia graminis f. sp. tritici]
MPIVHSCKLEKYEPLCLLRLASPPSPHCANIAPHLQHHPGCPSLGPVEYPFDLTYTSICHGPLKKKKAIRVQVPTLRPASNKPMPTTSEPDLTAPAIPALDLPVHVTPAHGLPSPPHTQPDSTHDKHPAQDAAALGTSDQDTNTFEELPGPDPRFATVPEELKFYLKPNVELDARPSTKATLLKMIRHFLSRSISLGP